MITLAISDKQEAGNRESEKEEFWKREAMKSHLRLPVTWPGSVENPEFLEKFGSLSSPAHSQYGCVFLQPHSAPWIQEWNKQRSRLNPHGGFAR